LKKRKAVSQSLSAPVPKVKAVGNQQHVRSNSYADLPFLLPLLLSPAFKSYSEYSTGSESSSGYTMCRFVHGVSVHEPKKHALVARLPKANIRSRTSCRSDKDPNWIANRCKESTLVLDALRRTEASGKVCEHFSSEHDRFVVAADAANRRQA
jgi:hypothetical protein